MSNTPKKVYLGDGAYAEYDGYGIVLTAENGVEVTDSVYLESNAWENLKRFVDSIKSHKEHIQ